MLDTTQEKDMYRRLTLDAGVPRAHAEIMIDMFKNGSDKLTKEDHELLTKFSKYTILWEGSYVAMNNLSYRVGKMI